MHEEELREVRRVNEIRERELEDQAISLAREKQALFEKAKLEA